MVARPGRSVQRSFFCRFFARTGASAGLCNRVTVTVGNLLIHASISLLNGSSFLTMDL